MMDKVKKTTLILVLVITCVITSVVAVLIYSNYSEPSYEKMIKAVVGKDNYKNVESCDYSFERYYLYTDGSKVQADSGSGNYIFEKWD